MRLEIVLSFVTIHDSFLGMYGHHSTVSFLSVQLLFSSFFETLSSLSFFHITKHAWSNEATIINGFI